MDAGLRLRSAPTTASDTVAIEPPGALLRVIEPVDVATPKIGVYDQWIHVRDGQGREGYVAAWYVEAGPTVPLVEDGGETTPPVPVPPEPVSDSEVEPEPVPIPVPEPEPVPEEESLTVFVLQSVGEAGLRLRKTPGLGGALVAVEKAGAALTVLEPAETARPKIGVKDKWIHVSDPKRRQGYVAAEYVELGADPTPEAPVDTPAPVLETVTVFVSGAAAAGLRMRSAPTTNSSTLKILAPSTALTLLEGTAEMVGAYGKWLKVRDPEGDEGYVAAWYVRK